MGEIHTVWHGSRARFRCSLAAAALVLLPAAARAHDHSVSHTPKMKVFEAFFAYLGGNMLAVATRAAVIVALLLFLWFVREPLDRIIKARASVRAAGPPSPLFHTTSSLVFDRAVEHPSFKALQQWCVVFFMRCPALVLMFAAANKSLVVPGYPLEPGTLLIFQVAQVGMATAILTQAFLPYAGAAIFGTLIYLLVAFDWRLAVYVLPLLAVAIVYVGAPWDAWRGAAAGISARQMKWVQFATGLSLFLIGWTQVYNYYATVSVADSFPILLRDPLLILFYGGTSPHLARECWAMALGMVQVTTGFLIMTGTFSRVCSIVMLYLLARLMITNFGWDELPNLYLIGALLVIATSNDLTTAFTLVHKRSRLVTGAGQGMHVHSALSLVLAAGLAVLAIYPALWLLTRTHPRPVPAFEARAKWQTVAPAAGQIAVDIPQIPMTAGESAQLHFRLRAQVRRGSGIGSVEWVDRDYPGTDRADDGAGATIRTAEAPLATADTSRQLLFDVPPALSMGAGDMNGLVLTVTRVEDTTLQAPESLDVPFDR